VFLPYRPAVEGGIHNRAFVDVVETPDPGKAVGIIGLEKLAERDRVQLLEGLGEPGIEILCKNAAVPLP
jgi:hypothetical protein